jgi:hypothetical protein
VHIFFDKLNEYNSCSLIENNELGVFVITVLLKTEKLAGSIFFYTVSMAKAG